MQYLRIYAGFFATNIGSWLTFIAITLYTKEHYGVAHISYIFMVQALIPLMFSSVLAKWATGFNPYKIFLFSQVLLAISACTLAAYHSLVAIYVFLVVTGLIKALSLPLVNNLVSQRLPSDESKTVFTRLGAFRQLAMIIGPSIGGVIYLASGMEALLIIDALMFLAAIVLLSTLSKVQFNSQTTDEVELSKQPTWQLVKQSRLALALLSYFILMCVGAYLNGIEFKLFEAYQLSEQEIGFAVSSWGIGGLFTMVLARFNGRQISLVHSTLMLLSFIAMWLLPNAIVMITSFVILGYCFGMLAGSMQGDISKGSKPLGKHGNRLWAVNNQLISLANVIFLGLTGLLVGWFSASILALGLVALTGIFVLCQLIGLKRYRAVEALS